MKHCYALVVAGLFLSLPTTAWSANEPTENLKDWQWLTRLQLPAANGAKTFDFLVPPPVFDKTLANLDDLRLRDAENKEVPYDLRIRRTRNQLQPLPADAFDAGTDGKGNATLSLDLKTKDVKHNAIDVVTTGSNFRRKVRIEGRDKDGEWTSLLPASDSAELLSFDVDNQHLNVSRFVYPESRRQFVRVIVSPDLGKDNDKPAIKSVTLSKYEQDQGLFVFAVAQVTGFEPIRENGGFQSMLQRDYKQPIQNERNYSSAWTLSFDGCTVPVDRLMVEVAENEFAREYIVEQPLGDGNFRQLTRGEWRQMEGETRKPLEIHFDEVVTNRLRLVIVDSLNPKLTLTQVTWSAPARQVVLPATATGQLMLYVSNASAPRPAYDFAAALPAKLNPPPARIDANRLTLEPNPDYQPPPVPFTEQFPWAVYVVLSVASLIMLGLIVMLVRQALARAPKQQAAT